MRQKELDLELGLLINTPYPKTPCCQSVYTIKNHINNPKIIQNITNKEIHLPDKQIIPIVDIYTQNFKVTCDACNKQYNQTLLNLLLEVRP